MPSIGPMELIIILVIVIIIFGVGRLPEIGGALGKGIREFRRSQEGLDELPEPAGKPEDKPEDKEET
ncbi:MAG: twin-arginine translocase TatA/TatE family subunit [Anaerolineae bacterium]